MVYAQIHDFGLISFQTHQEFKWFSSRKSVKSCNFFEKIKIFHEYRWYHHSEVRNGKPMPWKTFLDHKTFWIWKNFKIDFFHFFILPVCYFSLRIWKTAKMTKKWSNFFFVEISRAPEYSEGHEIFFSELSFRWRSFQFLLFADRIKIDENPGPYTPQKNAIFGGEDLTA